MKHHKIHDPNEYINRFSISEIPELGNASRKTTSATAIEEAEKTAGKVARVLGISEEVVMELVEK